MDRKQFDALTRSLSSRRTALAGVLGGVAALLGLAVPEEADAHNFLARCRKINDGPRRQACLRRARAHNRAHRTSTCVSQSPAMTCAAGCGIRINNCGQPTACPCSSGKECLSNGSCAETCDLYNPCPTGCHCPHHPSPEGAHRCAASFNCTEQTPRCESIAQCPAGQQCQAVYCAGSFTLTNRCLPVCPS